MSDITFSPDGSYFTVPADDPRVTAEHRFETERWYPMPVPKAVQDSWGYISAERSGNYWLVRRPLPPMPKAKTQADIDKGGLKEWYADCVWTKAPSITDAWHAALAWERSRKP